MRRKISLVSVLLASGLAIAGCGSNDEGNAGGSSAASDKEQTNSQDSGQQATSSSELAPEITEKRPEPKQADLNKKFPVTSNGKPLPGAEAKVTSLTVGQKCEFGAVNDGEAGTNKLKNDQKLVQVKAEIDVKANAGQGSAAGESEPLLLDDPTIVDSAGKNRQIISSSYCQVSRSEYQDWIMGAEPGKTTKLYGSWIVPADTKGIIFSGEAFKVD